MSSLAISPLGIYPEEIKINIHEKTCMQMFILVLFISAPKCKQPNVHQQINCSIPKQLGFLSKKRKTLKRNRVIP